MRGKILIFISLSILTFGQSSWGDFDSSFVVSCRGVFRQNRASSVVGEPNPDKIFFVSDSTNQNFYFEARLDGEGILEISTVLSLPEFGMRSVLSGKKLYREMIEYFGLANIQAIRGIWVDGTNFYQFFFFYDQGLSKEDAALETWSGQRAQDFGFSVVRNVEIAPDPLTGVLTVNVLFEKALIDFN